MSSPAPRLAGDALSEPDQTLLALARAARARVRAREGAAVRDDTGRSYASSEVTLPSLELTALEAAVAQASAAGARRLEAALVVVAEGASELSLAAVADLGGHGVPVFTAHSDGSGQIVALTQTTT